MTPPAAITARGTASRFVLDHIADEQLVRGEVALVVRVVPDVRVPVLGIRLVFCVGPLANAFGRVTVPLSVGIGQIEVWKLVTAIGLISSDRDLSNWGH